MKQKECYNTQGVCRDVYYRRDEANSEGCGVSRILLQVITHYWDNDIRDTVSIANIERNTYVGGIETCAEDAGGWV